MSSAILSGIYWAALTNPATFDLIRTCSLYFPVRLQHAGATQPSSYCVILVYRHAVRQVSLSSPSLLPFSLAYRMSLWTPKYQSRWGSDSLCSVPVALSTVSLTVKARYCHELTALPDSELTHDQATLCEPRAFPRPWSYDDTLVWTTEVKNWWGCNLPALSLGVYDVLFI
jgi:hypothetical protein